VVGELREFRRDLPDTSEPVLGREGKAASLGLVVRGEFAWGEAVGEAALGGARGC
jgi:hypothetical protein